MCPWPARYLHGRSYTLEQLKLDGTALENANGAHAEMAKLRRSVEREEMRQGIERESDSGPQIDLESTPLT